MPAWKQLLINFNRGLLDMETDEKMQLHRLLDTIPQDRLAEVRDYLAQMTGDDSKSINRTSLSGLWLGSGLENINFEAELQESRNEMEQSILRKQL